MSSKTAKSACPARPTNFSIRSTSEKPTWACKPRRVCLLFLLCILALSAKPVCVSAAPTDPPPVSAVKHYGASEGGIESIGSLVELNMKGWKPQSNRGIEIGGWSSEKTGRFTHTVTYTYREHGRPQVSLAWRLDVSDGSIRPLNELSGRLMKMSRIL